MLQNERRHAPTVSFILGKREEVSRVRMQPCPPTTSRDKDCHTGNTFRERKFKGEYYGSALNSEGKSSRKRGEYTEKRSNPETITSDLPSSALRPLTVSDVQFEFEETLTSEEDYDVKNNIQERTQVRRGSHFLRQHGWQLGSKQICLQKLTVKCHALSVKSRNIVTSTRKSEHWLSVP